MAKRPNLAEGSESTRFRASVQLANITPDGTMSLLSQREVERLCEHNDDELGALFRRCALAVLSSGLELDDARDRIARFADFRITMQRQEGGISLELRNAPSGAFVGEQMIRGIRQQLFAALRDLIYTNQQLGASDEVDLASSSGITDVVFRILRNARTIEPRLRRALVVCWGGHAINRVEYDYTKAVGYALGLRCLDICTGCGPGAMKGPMKGATIAHAKQRIADGRYIGITEPGIIAAEAPNPIVNALVIMPDIEKRLEAFVRLGHALIVFPGGVGTAEELLYILGVLAHPQNVNARMPLILTGPAESAAYFAALDEFIHFTLGPASAERYQIIIDDPNAVADAIASQTEEALGERIAAGDADSFNWRLKISEAFQTRFSGSHEAMAALNLSRDLPPHEMASNLRRAFSGIVAGNVKESGIAAVEAKGPFMLRGDAELMASLDRLLRAFVAQGRMRLATEDYQPCYVINA